MTSLNGKVAIVTGASSGIGRATALLFAREGAEVVVTAQRRQALEQLVAEIAAEGGTAVARAGDIRDETCAKALVALAVESYGGLDIAFNNAGTLGEMGPATGVSLDGWRETLDTNLTGAFIGAKHQLRAMIAPRRRLADLHLDLRRPHGGHARHGSPTRRARPGLSG